MKYLIAGLGNIGQEYANTRHNIGFIILNAFEATYASVRHAWLATHVYRSRRLILIKPTTYMNNSGKAINYWMQKERLTPAAVLVVVDDLDLPFGTLRLRTKGSSGGHNGLQSVQDYLNTSAYARLRVGIGRDATRRSQTDYVLGEFDAQQQTELPTIVQRAKQIIYSYCTIGAAATMNTYHAS